MGKNERRIFYTKTIQNTRKHRVTGRIDILSRNIVTGDPSPCHQGHFRSWKVASSFSGISLDRNQLERWKHHRCVQADDTDRLICNMTFSGQVMTLTWCQIFNMIFMNMNFINMKVKLYIIRCGSTRETRCWQNKCCVFTESKVITKKTFIAKNGYFWSFCSLESKPLTLGQIWGDITLKELSKALLRSTVALLVLELCASLSKKYWNRPNLTFGDLWWPDLWPDLKMTEVVSPWFLTLFRMPLTACRYVAQEPR